MFSTLVVVVLGGVVDYLCLATSIIKINKVDEIAGEGKREEGGEEGLKEMVDPP